MKTRWLDKEAFREWVKQDGKFAVFDDVGALDDRAMLENLPNVYLPQRPAWRTYESILNKDKRLVQNLCDYLES